VESLLGITHEVVYGGIGLEQGSSHYPEAEAGSLGASPRVAKSSSTSQAVGRVLKLVRRHASSRIEEGAAILDYKGPRIPVGEMHGGLAMKKAAKRARR
jgi:hypothetical protein